nr:MAG TPA: hypothetical protein [Caudoviricetes sp.]
MYLMFFRHPPHIQAIIKFFYLFPIAFMLMQ